MSRSVTLMTLGAGILTVNCYRVATERGVVLVDTGMGRHRTILKERFRTDGVDLRSVRLIFITH